MQFAVGPQAARVGHRVIAYDRLDSTNSEAMRLARAGERGPYWVIAAEQSAGRGRRGREWVSLTGNLFATLLLRLTCGPAQAATLGFVAALAVHEACRACADAVPLTLKWPNDVLADGRKLAGVLLESEACSSELAVAIGFGINLAQAPASGDAVALSAFETDVPPPVMFKRLSDAYAQYHALWDGGRGFAEIRAAWLRHAHGVNESIVVEMAGRRIAGLFETIDTQGRLLLRMNNGEIFPVSAGDVHFGDAATAGRIAGAA